ncbi:class I SAM-dependent methyltransferase [Rhodovulum sulfidophilum]|uniref:class I SAM-dependent methyltransferase n=1 Tax=Rhodovulum sulfidophilum TaxID=35806 RepID=UPI001389F939|nr:class I SAM-dependent methyltransferase [Rhodovulum sulfidophilum]NDK37043.1 class I SAM-dependent methyltransferase [Rhodovulum sulfidophilum]
MAVSITSITAANKAAWNASASLHAQGTEWDSLLEQAARPGFSVLDQELTEAIRALGIEGRSAAQVGCNNARELLSLASLKILPSVGIDQSGAFLEQGRILAKAAGLEPRLIEADIYELPEDVGTFDLVLITIGVLNWMPDLDGFFRVIAGLLSPGGHLLIYETHPVMEMFDPESETPHEPAISYFRTEPLKEEGLISYDGVDHGSGETGYWFIHTLGQIVTSCAANGMAIRALKEFGYSIREPEYDVYEGREAQIPMSYLLHARKI